MITVISGTNRTGSNTRKVAAVVEDLYRGLGAEVQVLDLRHLPVELFSPDAYASKPAGFQPFADAVIASSGLVIVTPEYNGSMPGALKLFIDHLKFPESFDRRPVCFVGLAAGVWGALRSVEQLQLIFGYRNAHLFPPRVFIPGIGAALTPEGRLADPELNSRLQAQAAGFLNFVARLQSVAPGS